MMTTCIAGFYARVSSEQQASSMTIASQIAALRRRMAEDGVAARGEHEFIDDGWSGATLVRPALERLRDVAAAGGLNRLYVLSPDRLSRKYAYQVVLVEELERAGVVLCFLSDPLDASPQIALLQQLQGMIAEYERAQITERTRRGKRYGAQQGAVSALSGAPYGYRYVPKGPGEPDARYEIVVDQARVVRQIFTWVGHDRLTLGVVQQRLGATGERTRNGTTTWDRGTLRRLLRNPAYMGQAAYGKTQSAPPRPRLRPLRGHTGIPRHTSRAAPTPATEWIRVAVPPLVSAELFAAVAEQLTENRTRARARHAGPGSLLSGLVCCAQCGYAYAAGGRYYRCSGTDAWRFGGTRLCTARLLRRDEAERLVWEEVRALLEDPGRLQAEYERRLAALSTETPATTAHETTRQLGAARTARERLIDSYTAGLITREDFTARITRFTNRIAEMEATQQQIATTGAARREIALVIGQLATFAHQIQERLDAVDLPTKQTLIRALVKRVEVENDQLRVVFRVPSTPDPPSSPTELQHRGRGGAPHPTSPSV